MLLYLWGFQPCAGRQSGTRITGAEGADGGRHRRRYTIHHAETPRDGLRDARLAMRSPLDSHRIFNAVPSPANTSAADMPLFQIEVSLRCGADAIFVVTTMQHATKHMEIEARGGWRIPYYAFHGQLYVFELGQVTRHSHRQS
jgi:hypothetical protein